MEDFQTVFCVVGGCMFLFCYMLSILVLSVVYIYEINVETKRSDFDFIWSILNPSFILQSLVFLFSV